MKLSLSRLAVALCALSMSPMLLAVDHVVTVGGTTLGFSPQTLTINVGDRVFFRNEGGTHNVAADNGLFRCSVDCAGLNSGTGDPSSARWEFGVQLNATGTLGYHCDAHGAPGSGEFGTIIVQQGPAPTPVPITSGFTGAWYDPNQSGHGIFLEVLPDGRLLAWWFTFDAEGRQSWFGGTGLIQGNRAVVRAALTTGGRWIPNFNPAAVTNVDWGTLTFTFTNCNSGRVDFSSNLAAYGGGSMNLTRLTQPAGLSCPGAPVQVLEPSIRGPAQ